MKFIFGYLSAYLFENITHGGGQTKKFSETRNISPKNTLDLNIACSNKSPVSSSFELKNNIFAQVKAEWAFKVFDYDEDNLLGHSDIRRVVEAITNSGEGAGAENIARLDKNQVASVVENVLNETDLNRTGFISLTEFKQIVTNSPDFAQSFRIKL